MKWLLNVLKNWLSPRIARAIANDGFKTDGPALNLYSLLQAANNQVENELVIAAIGAQSLTALQLLQGVFRWTGAFGGPANITTDTAAAIIAALGLQLPGSLRRDVGGHQRQHRPDAHPRWRGWRHGDGHGDHRNEHGTHFQHDSDCSGCDYPAQSRH